MKVIKTVTNRNARFEHYGELTEERNNLSEFNFTADSKELIFLLFFNNGKADHMYLVLTN